MDRIGLGTSGDSAMQATNMEIYEETRKRGIAFRLEEADRMYDQIRQERARGI